MTTWRARWMAFLRVYAYSASPIAAKNTRIINTSDQPNVSPQRLSLARPSIQAAKNETAIMPMAPCTLALGVICWREFSSPLDRLGVLVKVGGCASWDKSCDAMIEYLNLSINLSFSEDGTCTLMAACGICVSDDHAEQTRGTNRAHILQRSQCPVPTMST
jgi:hypothetical protein